MITANKHILSIINYMLVAIAAYFFSLYYSHLYIKGDQYFYSNFYEKASSASIDALPYLQFQQTGSAEPLYGILVWIGAGFIHKYYWISLFNSMFVVTLTYILNRRRISPFIFPLIFTNYYLFVLLFSAERLKFAILMGLLFIAIDNRWKYMFAVCAPLFHFQIILFAASFISGHASAIIKGAFRGVIKLSPFLISAVLATGLGVLLFMFAGAIQGKVAAYKGAGFLGLIKISIFFLISMFFSRDRISTFLSFSILSAAILAFGEERVNIIGFLFMLTTLLTWNRGFNPLLVIFLLYYSYQGVDFLFKIAKYGTGYVN